MKKNKKRMKQRRKSMITGTILIFMIMISGTFAFVMLNQTAFNPDYVDVLPGGRIHNVFQGGRVGSGDNAQDMFGSRNQNVFAENFGDVPIGVRVQLREFVSIGDNPFVTTMDLNETSTWNPVRFDPLLERAAGTNSDIEALGIELELGQREGEIKVYMPTFNHVNQTAIQLDPTSPQLRSIFNNVDAARFSETSGRAIDPLAASWVNGQTGDGSVEAILNWQDYQAENAVDDEAFHTVDGFRGQTGRPEHDGTFGFWNEQRNSVTGTRWYLTSNGVLDFEEGVTMVAQETLEAYATPVMSLSQWIVAGRPRENIWVHDESCAEGWFYWVGEHNGMIQPGVATGENDFLSNATSLLLRETVLPIIPQLQYVVHINADFFVATDLPLDILDNMRVMSIYDSEIELPTTANEPQYRLVNLSIPNELSIVPGSYLDATIIIERQAYVGASWELVDPTMMYTEILLELIDGNTGYIELEVSEVFDGGLDVRTQVLTGATIGETGTVRISWESPEGLVYIDIEVNVIDEL